MPKSSSQTRERRLLELKRFFSSFPWADTQWMSSSVIALYEGVAKLAEVCLDQEREIARLRRELAKR